MSLKGQEAWLGLEGVRDSLVAMRSLVGPLRVRLVPLLAPLVALMGGVFVPEVASAFCRTTTTPLPPDYRPTRGCYTDGLFLFWRNACVSYSINQAGSRNIPYDVAKRIIDTSFGAWSALTCNGAPAGISASNIGPSSCSELKFNLGSANQNLIVFRDESWPYRDANSTLGLTTVTFNAVNGEIYDADMELNSSERNLSTTETITTKGFDLESVVTHEAGHFFGLAHSGDASATMFASYKPGSTELRTLSQDDINGFCAIYPDTSTRVVSPSVSANETIQAEACNPAPRGGFTAQCSSPKPAETSSCAMRTVSGASAATPRSLSSVGAMGLALAGALALRRRRHVCRAGRAG